LNLSSTADLVSSSSVLASSLNVSSDSILVQSVDVPPVSLDKSIASPSVSSQLCHDSLPPQPSIESASEDLQTSLHCSPSTENITKVDILPPFTQAHLPTFKWDDIDGCIMSDIIDKCYDKIVHWHRNLFKVPSGIAGKAFVGEIAQLLNAFANALALEAVAFKTTMVMPALLLQKSHRKSKAKKHASHLSRRLTMWNSGKVNALFKEAQVIQNQLKQNCSKYSDDSARKFAKLMLEGKVKNAMKLLSNSSSGGPLKLNNGIKSKLLEKHPARQPPHPSVVLPRDNTIADSYHPIIFEQINAQLIHKTVLQMDGAAGPSGLDTTAWKRLCSSFGESSSDLCAAIASVSKRLCTEYVDPICTSALLAGRLIALDKCPGIRPIGVGETLRRIITRAITSLLKHDIGNAAGSLHLCAGQESGCESAIHALNDILDQPCSK
jgi:hypothetical protein